MKLFQFVAGLAAAQEAYESCSDLNDKLPDGVASVSCSGAKCKAVCEPGKLATGKKAVKCKEKNGKFRWNKKLSSCAGCDAPSSDDANIDFACRVTNKGINLCNTKCKNGGNVTGEGYGDGFPKVKLQCSCPKNEGYECGWYYEGEQVDPEGIYCVGGSDTTTTKKTTKPTDSTSGMTTTPTQTTKTTGDTTTTKTTKTTTTNATTKTTTTKATTTTKTTAATTAGTTAAPGTDCTANSDGTCGNANKMESYLFVNFENEALSSQQVSLDPRLCHLDHISQNAYVGVGNGISTFGSNPKAQSVVVRVDRCSKMNQYADKTNTELGPPSGSADCKNSYSWAWKGSSSKHNMLGFVATSPDGTYVIAAGVKEKSNNVHARWLIKFDAATGAVVWEFEMPTNNNDGLSANKQSGYESIAFTADGGFIAGGWGNHEGGWPAFKSGGQVEFGVPIFQKFGANVAKRTTAFNSAPTPKWTFKCDATNCGPKAIGSMKTMRVFMDNGVEKVISSPGTGADIIIVNAADGTKSAYKNFSGFTGNFQDVEPLIVNGAVTGYGVTGLDTGYTVPKGEGGCIQNGGCGSIFGHTSLIKPDLSGFKWSKTFNDFPGGTGNYNNIAPLSHAVVLTECWGLTQTLDANGNGNGFAAACGQGIEGCREYLTGINESTLNACSNDPRTTWRGTAVHHDASGAMTWYRNDNERAYEFVDRGPNGQLVFLSDKPIGFGFATLKN